MMSCRDAAGLWSSLLSGLGLPYGWLGVLTIAAAMPCPCVLCFQTVTCPGKWPTDDNVACPPLCCDRACFPLAADVPCSSPFLLAPTTCHPSYFALLALLKVEPCSCVQTVACPCKPLTDDHLLCNRSCFTVTYFPLAADDPCSSPIRRTFVPCLLAVHHHRSPCSCSALLIISGCGSPGQATD